MPSIIVTKRRMKRIQHMFSQMPPPPPPLHRYTIFTSSQPLFNSPSVEMYDKQRTEASQAPFFSICVSIFTIHSHTLPRPQWSRAAHNWLLTIQTTVSGMADDLSNAALVPGGMAEEKGCTIQVADGTLCNSFWRQRTYSSSFLGWPLWRLINQFLWQQL